MTRRSHAHAEEFRRPSAPLEALPLFGGEPAPVPAKHVVEVRAHLRTIGGEGPPSGREKRDTALANQEAKGAAAKALAYVRGQLANLYRSRVRSSPFCLTDHGVTADDADRILKDWPQFPRELTELPKQNWRGAIFNPLDWEKTGISVPATRGHMNGTTLPLWRLRDREAQSA